jgi:thioredoxin reductase (NADPH)
LRFGTEIKTETIKFLDTQKQPFEVTTEGGDKFLAHSVIIATGATAKRMDVEGSDEYWQKGVSACAVCDGALPLFRNKPLVVVGGGDSAMEESSFLTKFASQVFLVHRRDEFRASKIMQDRTLANPKIKVLYSHTLQKVHGDGKLMTGVELLDLKTQSTLKLDASGLFFAIGHVPNASFLKAGSGIEIDETGYIKTVPGSTKTSIPGIFACGDVQDKRYRQAITAAGSGCMAALDAEHYLGENHLI